MSTQTTELPNRVQRKVSNRNDDAWYEYQGETIFGPDARDRIRQRFREMRASDYEKIATPKGGSRFDTKIRTSDLEDFKTDLEVAEEIWIEEHGDPLTSFGNAYYGDVLTDYEVVEVHEEKPRKTVLWAKYDAGYRAFMGGADGKKQSVLLPIRTYEQWSYQTEVVDPLFSEYHEKYPY